SLGTPHSATSERNHTRSHSDQRHVPPFGESGFASSYRRLCRSAPGHARHAPDEKLSRSARQRRHQSLANLWYEQYEAINDGTSLPTAAAKTEIVPPAY